MRLAVVEGWVREGSISFSVLNTDIAGDGSAIRGWEYHQGMGVPSRDGSAIRR